MLHFLYPVCHFKVTVASALCNSELCDQAVKFMFWALRLGYSVRVGATVRVGARLKIRHRVSAARLIDL